MRNEDLVRIKHMLDSAREAVSFASESSRGALENDRKLELALVKVHRDNRRGSLQGI